MKQKLSSAFSLALILALVLATGVFADVLHNDIVVDPATITLIPGGASVAVGYYIQPTTGSGDADPQCNFDSPTEYVTFTINTPTGVTANPTSLKFEKCHDGSNFNYQYVSFSANASAESGNVTYTQTANNSGGTFTYDQAFFYVNVEKPSDTTAPVISYVLNPASPDGASGWYVSAVTLTWTVTENESPSSLVKTGCVDQNITADQLATTYSCSATSDGGSAGPVEVTIKRDATLPLVSLVGGPANGESYYYGFVPAAPTCSASDEMSGLDGACSISGYLATVGTHTVTASVSDFAGNSNSDSATYTVLAWTLFGFYQPVDMSGVLNVVKGGSTVPLKFEVFAGTTELTDISVVKTFTQVKIACDGTTPMDEIEVTTTGATTLRYDAISGQFIQNWLTPKLPGQCYKVTLTTQDGSFLSALFKLK